ncbi:MAG: PhpK family radical P-methyltransferase [Acidobacteriota bacterium]|nr:PhpK family radical P-methyltransferase [Acidobacteriota bacterium]
MNFVDYEKTVRTMGLNSGAYRDLNLNFIRFNKWPYSISKIFNDFYGQEDNARDLLKTPGGHRSLQGREAMACIKQACSLNGNAEPEQIPGSTTEVEFDWI